LGPAAYLVTGAIAVVVAILAATPRGGALVRGTLIAVRSGGQRGSTRVARMHSRAEVRLREGSLAIAFLVGVLLGIPGPFDLVAFGHVARGSYGAIAAAGLILAFLLIKFVLIEAPIVGYAIDPDGTAAKVNRFSSWMKANRFAIAASVVGVIGVGLLVRGFSGLG
jgi:hypothetical protein